MSSDHQRRRLSEEERTLWGRITRAVVPLRRKPQPVAAIEAVTTPAKPKPVQKPAPCVTPSLEPLGRRQKQRLARGTIEIDARIDLHGRTQGEAHTALLRFLHRAQRDGARYVLVITGKGTRAGNESSERGVLKRQVPLWLRLPEFRGYVVGFEDAHIGHGGEGALYVRLRRVRS
jgi:DNA-nicking Smr family endonuclease